MILKALDLLRELGFGVISLIFNFINTIYAIIGKINELDIIGTMAGNKTFSSFYSSVVVIAVTVFGLFVTWQFAKKIIDPEETPSVNTILAEVFKCGALLFLSTFLFVQVSTFSIRLTGYVSTVFTGKDTTELGTALLINYIDYSNGYKKSEEFEKEDYEKLIKNGKFESEQHFNDKYVVKEHIIRSDERDYKYNIQWVVAIICGGFFLYALVFSALMVARRQIEFLFLFIISPVIYATSVCNKQRRGTLVEQLVSLTLQATAIVLIINIVALLAVEINKTSFFSNGFEDMLMRSVMYLGCAIFLLNGSNIVNQFIGANVSANNGREQLMSLMGYGKLAGTGAKVAAAGLAGGALLGAGVTVKGASAIAGATGVASKVGRVSNDILQKAGSHIAGFGSKFGSSILPDGSTMSSSNPMMRKVQSVGDRIRNYGQNMSSSAEKRNRNGEGLGLRNRVSSGATSMMWNGVNMMNPLNKVSMPHHTGRNPYK